MQQTTFHDARHSLPATLLARIRGEYQEMPGLHLTLAQAARLWHEHADVCRTVLDQLVAEGFLHRTKTGSYTALTSA
jgi:hypothetical protein